MFDLTSLSFILHVHVLFFMKNMFFMFLQKSRLTFIYKKRQIIRQGGGSENGCTFTPALQGSQREKHPERETTKERNPNKGGGLSSPSTPVFCL